MHKSENPHAMFCKWTDEPLIFVRRSNGERAEPSIRQFQPPKICTAIKDPSRLDDRHSKSWALFRAALLLDDKVSPQGAATRPIYYWQSGIT